MVLRIQGHESGVVLPIRAYEVEKVAQHDFLKIMWTNAIRTPLGPYNIPTFLLVT